MGRTKGILCTRTIRIKPVEPYDPERLLACNIPSVHNMLLRQVNFPAELHRGEHIAEFWSTLLDPGLWFDALNLLRDDPSRCNRLIIDGATEASFLHFCQKIVGRAFHVTGGIAVTYIEPGVGRPMIRLTAVGLGEGRVGHAVYSDNDGPHVRARALPGADPIPSTLTELLFGFNTLPRPPRLVPETH